MLGSTVGSALAREVLSICSPISKAFTQTLFSTRGVGAVVEDEAELAVLRIVGEASGLVLGRPEITLAYVGVVVVVGVVLDC